MRLVASVRLSVCPFVGVSVCLSLDEIGDVDV